LETTLSWLSDDVVRFKIEMGVVKKCTKMSTPFQTRQSRHIRRYRWRHYHWQATRLLRKYIGRCLCKRVDVYIITLLCTWRIYALSERLLVGLVLISFWAGISTPTWHSHWPSHCSGGRPGPVTATWVDQLW